LITDVFSQRSLNLAIVVSFIFRFPNLVGAVHVKAFIFKNVEKGACVTKGYLKICQEGKCFENLTCLEALFL
jgi:hypothetical protein